MSTVDIPCKRCCGPAHLECKRCGTPFCGEECYSLAAPYHCYECDENNKLGLIAASLNISEMEKGVLNEITPFTMLLSSRDKIIWRFLRGKLGVVVYGITDLIHWQAGFSKYYVTKIGIKYDIESLSGKISKVEDCVTAIFLVGARERANVYGEAFSAVGRSKKSIEKQVVKIKDDKCTKQKTFNVWYPPIPIDESGIYNISFDTDEALLKNLLSYFVRRCPDLTFEAIEDPMRIIILVYFKKHEDKYKAYSDEIVLYQNIMTDICRDTNTPNYEECVNYLLYLLLQKHKL